MRRLLLCWSVMMALGDSSRADVAKIPAEDIKTLREEARFHEIQAATNLPPVVLALCADVKGRLAEPGQIWKATDAIIDDKLPTKRLIWAVTDGNYYVVHYERGGYLRSYHVLVAKWKQGDGKPSLVWRRVGGRINDFKAFQDALGSNKL
jgi:hypothetical protein